LKAAETAQWLKSGAKPSETVRKLIKQATNAA
jgi:ribosomal protein S16